MSKILLIDADTILYSSAAQEQINKCLAIHKESGKDKLFDSKTDFNNWIKEQSKWKKEDFDFKVVSEITGEPRFAFQNVKQKIQNIVDASGCFDYKVCIQGEGNFRKFYESKFVDYKGQRGDKPLLYKEVFEYTVNKYKGRCVVVKGEETDDYVNQQAWCGYRKAYKTKSKEDSDVVIAYVDKDITANGRGWFLNYYHLEDGIFWQDTTNQAKEFWTQVLVGDTADNIPGIEKLSDELRKRYQIKTKGVGPVAANKILDTLQTERTMAVAVTECYRETWPDDWKERLQDNCFFLYLRRKPDEMFCLEEYFDKLKIKGD